MLMIEKVNVRKLNPVQREACDLLRLFKRRAGLRFGHSSRYLAWPVMSGENKGSMMVITPDDGCCSGWMGRLEDKLSTKGGV